MRNQWYKKYWQIGFTSHLYDLLAPEAYRDCFRRGVELVPDLESKIILDAGCGSGLLLSFLQKTIKSHYVGSDKLWSAVDITSTQSRRTGQGGSIVQSDLLEGAPFKKNSFDVVFAFFLVYTLDDPQKRKQILCNFRRILKPGGKLILVNPSRDYDPERIIHVSLDAIKERDGYVAWFFKKIFIYPLTLALGLNHVANQLKADAWHAYSREELYKEVEACDFHVSHMEDVYAGSAYLVLCGP